MATRKAKVKTPVEMDTTKPEATTADADANGDIDQRMAALLEDHKRMGARPAVEPVTVDAVLPTKK